ncbi:DDE superfamily endonuclease [Hirsutella rhossiliensis]
MTSLTAADRAARLIIESHDAFVEGRRRKTRGAPPKPVSVRQAARIFNVPSATVQKAVQRYRGGVARIGRPRLLSNEEDSALAAYVCWLQKSGFPASKQQVEAAALELLRRRNPNCQPPSKHWYRRWLDDHPELRVTYIKAVERSRKSFEAGDVCHVESFFKRLSEIITNHGIGPSEVWNEDECGIRIGSLRDRVHVLIVRTTRDQRPQVSDPGNRESCTLIAAANAVGNTIPPWLVFHTFPCESWGQIDAPGDVRFARSDTGFSNAEITLDWVHQFNIWSWRHSARAQRSGKTLEEWFGVDEWSRELEFPFHEVEPRSIPESERIYRLLVIDGFTGHTSIDFIQYCIKFDIIIAVFPPHSTHILQPLDVGVFQPLKHAQQKALRRFIDSGELNFTRLDFLESFWETFAEGFTARYIISGFEKTGIFPPTHEPAVKQILEQQLKLRQAINPAFASLLPKETRFEQAVDSIQHLQKRYSDLLSSPTCQRLSNASTVVTEASLLSSNLQKHYNDRLQRIEKMSARPKRGKIVKTQAGTFYTSVSLDEVRKSAKQTQQAEKAKSQRQEVVMLRAIIRQEKEQLLAEYRKNKVQFINGKQRRLTIKQWLDHVGKNEEFLSLETSDETYKRLLKRPGPFTIDTTRTPWRHARSAAEQEAADNACATARPLRNIRWPHLEPEHAVKITTSRIAEEETVDPALEAAYNGEVERALRSSSPQGPTPPSSPPITPTERISGWKRIKGIIRDFRVSRQSNMIKNTPKTPSSYI